MEQLSPRVCCPPWTVLEMFAQRNCQKANHVVKGVAIYLCSNYIAEERRQPSERFTGIPHFSSQNDRPELQRTE